jgi:hypothetical protein
MATGIGASMAGGKRGSGAETLRQKDDWYPTPPLVTQVLMDHVTFEGSISEPCCGDGSLAKIVEHYGYNVIGTDIEDRGYGLGHGPAYDILKANKLVAPNIITNPPFNISAKIIDHLMEFRPKKMALLLKATYWHAKNRQKLYEKYPPSQILALTWRPDFLHRKRPTMEVCWFIWDQDHVGETTYKPVAKPRNEISIPVPSFVQSKAA